ncbi:MAG: hypothetical protein K6A90_07455 [Lachnospiraceae bacterium]|nr:hypothetical protein [Lachnospiraceae bacterium]
MKKRSEMKKKVFPISMAVLWGIVFTNAMHSPALGICFGMLMGSVFGLFDQNENE